jgi:hypothetical protein
MKRLAPILLLLCTPVLAHDANHPELYSWFDHLSSGNGSCCSFADGRGSPILTGIPKTAITASVSTTNGSTFLTTPWSPSRTAPAER